MRYECEECRMHLPSQEFKAIVDEKGLRLVCPKCYIKLSKNNEKNHVAEV